jgi:hypothetical protein
MGKLHYDTDD